MSAGLDHPHEAMPQPKSRKIAVLGYRSVGKCSSCCSREEISAGRWVTLWRMTV